jgi:endonuclease YncB( thermonuclease family)
LACNDEHRLLGTGVLVRRALALVSAALLLGGCSETPPAGTEPESAATGTSSAEPAGAAGVPTGQAAVVAAVLDGDTIRLRNGREVRLVQIDAPEGNQGECYADRARDVLRAILPGGTRVILQADPRLDAVDQYGRLLRYVFKGQRNVNLMLVRQGAASIWLFEGERGRYAPALLRAARQAKAAGRGLWKACPGTRLDPLHAVDTGGPPASGTCPGAISWRDARAHTGVRGTVKGPVVGTLYASGSNRRPTFLNLGYDYPDPERVTVIIWGGNREKFRVPPEDAYAGKTICVTGLIELYRNLPEIEVSSPSQIEIAPPE